MTGTADEPSILRYRGNISSQAVRIPQEAFIEVEGFGITNCDFPITNYDERMNGGRNSIVSDSTFEIHNLKLT
jgi:hypothetical protein